MITTKAESDAKIQVSLGGGGILARIKEKKVIYKKEIGWLVCSTRSQCFYLTFVKK